MSAQITSSQDDFDKLDFSLSAFRIPEDDNGSFGTQSGLRIRRHKVWSHPQERYYRPQAYFPCHNSQDGNVIHLLTCDDKEEGLERFPDAAAQEPEGVWLVNIDKRQQHCPNQGLESGWAFWALLQKGGETPGLAPLWVHEPLENSEAWIAETPCRESHSPKAFFKHVE